jgi:hypothetical protein
VDYGDLMIIHDDSGNVHKLMNLDLERLSFSELVNEKHIMMDTLVDIKTHLPHEHRVEIFSNLFAFKGKFKDYLTLREIQQMLRLSSSCRSMWTRFVRVLSRKSAIPGFFKFRKYPSQDY